MEIKVLGTGCSKCKVLFKHVKKALEELERSDIKITKVEAIDEIMAYNVLGTPALVIDEEVIVAGRIASKKEIIALIEKNKNNQ